MVKKIFLISAGILCLVIAIVLIIHIFSGPSEPEPRMDELKLRLGYRLAGRAVADMRAKLPPTFDGAVLVHFQGHRFALDMERIIKEEIELRQALKLRDFEEFKQKVQEEKEKSTLSRWLDKVKDVFSDVAGQETHDKIFGTEMPADELKEVGIDGLVGGDVYIAEGMSAKDKELIRLTLWVRERMAGKKIFEETYVEELEKSWFNLEYYRFQMDELGWGWKVIIFLTFTILFPLATFFIPAKLLRFESNKVNMAMLVAYTILDLGLALFLMGFVLSGGAVLVLLLALVIAGVYNYGILTEIEDYT
jgi:hypothetical protein